MESPLPQGAVLFTDKAGCLLPWGEAAVHRELREFQGIWKLCVRTGDKDQTPYPCYAPGCSTRALQTRQPRRRTMLSVLEAGSPPSSSRWGCFWYPSGPACSSVPYGHSFQSKSDYGQPGGQALKPCGVRLSMCVPEGPQEPLEAVTSPSPWSSAPGKERFCCRSDPRGSTSQRPCRWRSGLRDSGRGPGSA
ncbi:uncharacterized protein LOC116657485 isoform X5 [Camelus ferus]|uniref:Uncharacterized protein LOC116657485 isoform X5 n=1 Tax=Camelus ferus TaxID=419612 RepID=A0A8B8RCI6_CAMFR|nr:uncharacterized protein LOC116657485 isoform X5 [Camelus ferus]